MELQLPCLEVLNSQEKLQTHPSNSNIVGTTEGRMNFNSLEEVIGWDLCTDALGYCVQPSSNPIFPTKAPYYWNWELITAEPKLRELGYSIVRWYTGDGDSFGPLTRVVIVEKDGVREALVYG